MGVLTFGFVYLIVIKMAKKVRLNQLGDTKLIIIIVLAILLGYFVFKDLVFPSLVNLFVNVATNQSTQKAANYDFTKAKSIDINQTVSSVSKVVNSQALASGILNIDGKGTDNQVTGTIKYLDQKPEISYKTTKDADSNSDVGMFTIKSGNNNAEERTLHFPSNLKTTFDINMAAGKANIDLTDINAGEINFATAAGSATITFSKKISSKAKLGIAAGNLQLYMPKTNGIKIIAASGTSFTNLRIGEDFELIDGGAKSKNYEKAKIKTEIIITQGVGSWSLNFID